MQPKAADITEGSHKAGKEGHLHRVDNSKRELRNIKGQHRRHPGNGPLVPQRKAAEGVQPQDSCGNGDNPIVFKAQRQTLNDAEGKAIDRKMPKPAPLPSKAADKKDVHYTLPKDADPVHNQAEIIHIRYTSLSYGAKGPGSIPAPAAAKPGCALPGTAGPAHPGIRPHGPDSPGNSGGT